MYMQVIIHTYAMPTRNSIDIIIDLESQPYFYYANQCSLVGCLVDWNTTNIANIQSVPCLSPKSRHFDTMALH